MKSVLKIVLAAIFVISATPSSEANLSSLQLLTNLVANRVVNATKLMKSLYPLLTSSNYLEPPLINIGYVNTKTCTNTMQLKDKLSVAYKKLSNFRSLLYIAYSYEEKQECQGSKHSQLAEKIKDTSYYLNGTVVVLRRELLKRKFSLPADPAVLTETKMNQIARGFLQALVNNKLLTLVITDDVVKIYRNYVMLDTLKVVINDVADCVY